MKDQVKPYTTTPRHIADDVRSGKITRPEWRVYQWLRINADPYGKVTTSFRAIRDDIYDDVDENYINTILLSLKRKNYLYYPPRKGRRGSFDVYFGDWLRPDGRIQHLDNHPAKNPIRGKEEVKVVVAPEPTQISPSQSQRLTEQKERLVDKFSMNAARQEVRGSYKENDIEKEKESTLSPLINEERKKIRVSGFTPKSYEEQVCWEAAREVGEEYMNPLLYVLNTHGVNVVERAMSIYRDHAREGKIVSKRGAYLQGIIKKLLEQQ